MGRVKDRIRKMTDDEVRSNLYAYKKLCNVQPTRKMDEKVLDLLYDEARTRGMI